MLVPNEPRLPSIPPSTMPDSIRRHDSCRCYVAAQLQAERQSIGVLASPKSMHRFNLSETQPYRNDAAGRQGTSGHQGAKARQQSYRPTPQIELPDCVQRTISRLHNTTLQPTELVLDNRHCT